MDELAMLHQMCEKELSNADIKALCKTRGFSDREAASPSMLETFYLSEIGVSAALAACTADEITTLHLLKFVDDQVDISFFTRLYNNERQMAYGYTFNQRYQDVFAQVRANLVRRGILLFAEEPRAWQAQTKLERLRFRLPQRFGAFLPPPIPDARQFDGPGSLRTDVLRDKILQLVRPAESPKSDLELSNGSLTMDGKLFSIQLLDEWQRREWRKETGWYAESIQGTSNNQTLSTVEAADHIFAQLRPNEWINAGQLAPVLKVFCGIRVDAQRICAAGWNWGYLTRQTIDGKAHYRLPVAPPPEEMPARREYLSAQGNQVLVDLSRIPYADLETLNLISLLEIAGDRLAAQPDLLKLGDAFDRVRDWPLSSWLCDNSEAYARAFEVARQHWGTKIIHHNLMVARVDDLSLYVQLEKTFKDNPDVVLMPNHYIAFPNDLTGKVTRAVTKAGHVIRTVQNNG